MGTAADKNTMSAVFFMLLSLFRQLADIISDLEISTSSATFVVGALHNKTAAAWQSSRVSSVKT